MPSVSVFSTLWVLLRNRSTTKARDIPICAASLTGVDVAKIVAVDGDQGRMEVFWLSQVEIPPSILWINGPRMKRDGLRWDPASLLGPTTLGVPPSRLIPAAKPSPEGLIVEQVEGFWLCDCPLPTAEGAVIEFTDVDSGVTFIIRKDSRAGTDQWDTMGPYWDNCVLLWQQPPTPSYPTPGALVCPTEKEFCITEGSIVSARWMVQVTVMATGGPWDWLLRRGLTS